MQLLLLHKNGSGDPFFCAPWKETNNTDTSLGWAPVPCSRESWEVSKILHFCSEPQNEKNNWNNQQVLHSWHRMNLEQSPSGWEEDTSRGKHQGWVTATCPDSAHCCPSTDSNCSKAWRGSPKPCRSATWGCHETAKNWLEARGAATREQGWDWVWRQSILNKMTALLALFLTVREGPAGLVQPCTHSWCWISNSHVDGFCLALLLHPSWKHMEGAGSKAQRSKSSWKRRDKHTASVGREVVSGWSEVPSHLIFTPHLQIRVVALQVLGAAL